MSAARYLKDQKHCRSVEIIAQRRSHSRLRLLDFLDERSVLRGPPLRSAAEHTSAYVSIRQHTSAYVIHQHTSAYCVLSGPSLQSEGESENERERESDVYIYVYIYV